MVVYFALAYLSLLVIANDCTRAGFRARVVTLKVFGYLIACTLLAGAADNFAEGLSVPRIAFGGSPRGGVCVLADISPYTKFY